MAFVLGIETSCDETAAALVTSDGEIVSSVVASQDELHAKFGGVVPEVASRRHLELIAPVIEEALTAAGATLDDVGAVAVTTWPGLIGALYLVGSVAMDDFQPEVSDVDFIALTEHRVTEHDLAELKWVHTRVAESGHPVFEGQWSRGVASCGERCRSSKVRY